MKCNIQKAILQNMLSKVQGFTEKKSTLPILSHVLLETVGDSLHVKATDLHTSIQVKSPCDVLQPGACAINGKSFYDIIRELPDQVLEISIEDNARAHISVENNKIKMNVMDPEEYPMIEFTDIDKGYTVDLSVMKPMIERTIFSIPASSESDSKYTLGGALLTSGKDATGKGYIEMVSTDTRRLSVVRYFTEDYIDMGGGIIVPRKGLQELKRLMDNREEDSRILLTRDSIFFISPDTTATVRLIDGKFPDYQSVVSLDAFPIYTRINAQELHSVLKVCIAMVSDISNCVKFSFKKEKTIVFASNPDQGEVETPIHAEHHGQELEINFNPRYFMDCLSFIEGDTEIRLKGPQGPCMITDNGITESKWVIMPMRF
ncbi:MAG TPA: DNA polymerase III subunit beta [Deltaproteobacteria bacterium]|jgi:DNA polymerase-3 subunit beta|nr:DNA polymerase III subunit beta [Deltaproteobacteria bacterium]HRR21011.1 DNA polymerase III subunit beta [Desulfomonilia bacterium]HOS28220.1 DNA polymerase III subunit beta [Deltaproteobacteria bacterium]HPX50450.1 DNA polymerase III subunit beta [Deltaproteobacteria bacterium]HQO79684.1 DNA polymerase III subunit beta [Deltaproteobacteria bacterium]